MPEREAMVAAARNGAIAASKLSEFGGREVLLKALWLRRNAMIGQHLRAGAAANGVP